MMNYYLGVYIIFSYYVTLLMIIYLRLYYDYFIHCFDKIHFIYLINWLYFKNRSYLIC